ncbi:MAG: hypothetical protein K2K01_04415 [Eubacterium sp.]|nr:hypothetical protein [Eubacterium sp.]
MKNKNKNETVLDKISRLSFTSAILSLCTIGICPVLSIAGIVAPLVMKCKGAELSSDTAFRNKKSLIAGIVALAMFALDLIILVYANSKLGWF